LRHQHCSAWQEAERFDTLHFEGLHFHQPMPRRRLLETEAANWRLELIK